MSGPRGQQRSESDASLAAAFDIFGEDSGTTSAATTMHGKHAVLSTFE